MKKYGMKVLFSAVLLFAIYSAYLYLFPFQKNYDKSLVLLAEQFLLLNTALPVNNYLPISDVADFHSTFYIFYGPFTSIVLMPFVVFWGKSTPQYLLGIISMIVSFYATYALSRKFNFSKMDALWLALFFVFSTVLLSVSVINISAYQVQAMQVPLIMLALVEYFSKKRPFVAGIFVGLAIMTRFVQLLAVLFFFIEVIRKRMNLKQFVLFLIPVLIACALLGAYNQKRFHNPFDTGYKYNITSNGFPLSLNRQYGEVSFEHISANLYVFLLMPPDPLKRDEAGFFLEFPYVKANPWGTAIWFTSPLFLYLVFKFRKNKYFVSALATSIALALPAMTFFSVGFAQFGYRYLLDFLPFLFLLLIPCLSPKLSRKAIFLIILGVLFNCIYIGSLWDFYPVLNITTPIK